jgi:proliferating cell nuclear antigen
MDPATILELLMEKATLFKKVLEVLRGQFSKANFAFSSTGLELQAVDTKCIALVVLQLHPKAFGSYICNNDDFSVGLNLADMDKAFSSANNDEIVTIESRTRKTPFSSCSSRPVSRDPLVFCASCSLP